MIKRIFRKIILRLASSEIEKEISDYNKLVDDYNKLVSDYYSLFNVTKELRDLLQGQVYSLQQLTDPQKYGKPLSLISSPAQIQFYIKELNTCQVVLAEELGVTPGAVSRAINGDKPLLLLRKRIIDFLISKKFKPA